MKSNPDSVLILLNEIEEPEALDNDIFAKWCLLYGNVKLQELSTKQIERALEWYMRHGVIKEKVMKNLCILLLLLTLSSSNLDAACERCRKIVFKVINLWDRERAPHFMSIDVEVENSNLFIRFHNNEMGAVCVKVIDSHGNIMYQDEVPVTSKESYRLELQSLPKGNYKLIVSDENIEISGDFDL